MRFLYLKWGIALALLLPAAAHTLEETAAIKVTPLVKATTSWNGERIAYPRGEAEITGMVIEIAPGATTGWHAHPVPSFAMVIEGTLDEAENAGGPGVDTALLS